MSYNQGQGTAVPLPVDDPGSSAASVGFLQVIPEDFTRTELHKLLDKVRDLSQYGIFDDTKRDLLVDLAETLDLLDALAARDELDIMDMKVEQALPPLPSCKPDCPYHPWSYGRR